MKPTPLHFRVLVAAALLVASWSGQAYASASKARCIGAYEDGQRLELQRSLKLAAEQFLFCSSAECPTSMHRECKTMLASVQAATPVVVLFILNEAGAPLRNVRIAIDHGAAQAFIGEPLTLDPGEHRFRFEAEGYASAERSVSLTFAGKTSLEVRLAPALGNSALESAGAEAPQSCLRALCRTRVKEPPRAPDVPSAIGSKGGVRKALLLGTSAVGVLGGVGLAYFGLSARRGDHDLSACSPGCSKEAVADVRSNYLLANTSLAVGIAGLVGTALVWFTVNPARVEPRQQSFRSWNVHLGLISFASTSF